MTKMKAPPIARDWLSKTLAGLLLGLLLGLAASSLFVLLTPALPNSVRSQLAMWMVVPIWLTALSTVYFFQSGLRAWLWLGAGNILLVGIIVLIRFI